MPEAISSTTPASVGGEGAVIFDKTIDPLTLQLHNMDVLQQGAEERKADQAQFLKTTTAIQATLNVNQDGAWSGDMKFLTDKAQELQTAGVNALKSGAGLNSLDYQNLKTAYSGYLNKSQQYQKYVDEGTKGLLTDKGEHYDVAASNAAIAAPGATSLDKRSWSGSPLLPIQSDPDATTEKFVNTFANQKTSKAGQQGGYEVVKETDEKVGIGALGTPQFENSVLGLAYGDTSRKSMQAGYSNLPLTAKNDYIKQATTQGYDANSAPGKAYEMYVADKLLQHKVVNQTVTIHGETEAAKVAAKKQGSTDDQIGAVKEFAAYWTRDPKVMTSTNYLYPARETALAGQTDPTTPKKVPLIGTTMLNTAVDLGKFTTVDNFEKVEHDNHITFAGYDPTDGTHIVATVQSEYNYAKGLSQDPFIHTNSFRELATTLANKIPKSSKEEGLDPLSGVTAYAEKYGWDADKINPLSDEQQTTRTQRESMVPGTRKMTPTGLAPNNTLPVQGAKQATATPDPNNLRTKYNY